MKWLLDTNVLSELFKASPASEVLDWIEKNERDFGISVISLGELILGIERLPEGRKRRRLERSLKFLREDYEGKLLDFTEGVSVEWGRLLANAQSTGRNLSALDSQIEATAIHYGLSVVTRNSTDFFGETCNPWS